MSNYIDRCKSLSKGIDIVESRGIINNLKLNNMWIFITLLIVAILSFIGILSKPKKQNTMATIGCMLPSLLLVIGFWSLIIYVIYHFISKYW
jgi:hypothetical protein